MNLKESIKLVAQLGNELFSEKSIQVFANDVVGINPELGLMVLAASSNQGDSTTASKSVEIMLDDMQLNLNSTRQDSPHIASVVSRCISESLENINEYLYFQAQRSTSIETDRGVDLSVIQILPNTISCGNIGNLNCVLFSNSEMVKLNNESMAEQKLGIKSSLQSKIIEHDFAVGDILILSAPELMSRLGEEFIRVTLSRFDENLEMAIRQINTRALHHGFKHKPTLILCRKIHSIEASRSWFNKLLN